jgi:hypothetical protein
MSRAGIVGLLAVFLIAAAPIQSQPKQPRHGENSKSDSGEEHADQKHGVPKYSPSAPQRSIKATEKSAHDSTKEPRHWLEGWNLSDRIAVIASLVALLQFGALVATVIVMVNTSRRQLRAYIGVTTGSLKFGVVDGVQMAKATIRIKNFGQTPAFDVTSMAHIEAAAEFSDEMNRRQKKIKGRGAIYPQDSQRVIIPEELNPPLWFWTHSAVRIRARHLYGRLSSPKMDDLQVHG